MTRLKEEVCRWEQEGGELRTVVGTLKNKLSVAEVRAAVPMCATVQSIYSIPCC